MKWSIKTTGIPDDLFIRGQAPMTKSEVRSIALSKLRLEGHHQVLDIGCGTGSVTIECALLCSEGKVTAVDISSEAIQLTQANLEFFEIPSKQVRLLHGDIVENIDKIPLVDRIFLGGGGRKVYEHLDKLKDKLKPKGILVANTILLQNTSALIDGLKKAGFSELECVLVNLAKGIDSEQMMMRGHNPIYIVSGVKKEEKLNE